MFASSNQVFLVYYFNHKLNELIIVMPFRLLTDFIIFIFIKVET